MQTTFVNSADFAVCDHESKYVTHPFTYSGWSNPEQQNNLLSSGHQHLSYSKKNEV